jgi:hypothetical protein
MTDPISTSPLAMQAFKIIQHLDQLVGPGEAQMFMMRGNEHLAGDTPVAAIKSGHTEQVRTAVKCLAIEKGLFEEPFLPHR